MCGIAGIVGQIDETHRAALRRMSDAMTHRGPDADGFWEAEPDSAGWGPMLAHRRLAILDLSPSGVQPMIDGPTGDVVVLNGEIYNYRALRAELPQGGADLGSSGDTAVMLRSLSLHGAAAIPRLRGMFAFAHWSRRDRRLTLARDPLGIKPLYLARNPDPKGRWSLAFASELRALLASGLLGRARLDPTAVASVVWNGFTVAPNTVVEGIETMWPGELLVADARGTTLERRAYWQLPRLRNQEDFSEEALAAALKDCVHLHLASDVPLGIFLSGGVDSSAVAHLAQQSSQTPVHTFTLAFEEAEHNEGEHARAIAKAIGTEHRELLLTESLFTSRLDDALASLDQPSFDGLNSYFMSHAVAQAGFKVALVGSGGDELFGGYTTFRDLPVLARWARRTQWLPAALKRDLARRVARFKQPSGLGFPAQTRWAKLPEMVARGDDLLGLYQMAYALFLPQQHRELLGAQGRDRLHDGLPEAMRIWLGESIAARSDLGAISALEQRLFLGERLLRDTDAVSMSASIEVRLPLVDQMLLEQVGRVPDAVRYHPIRRKTLLRRVGLKGLDPALFDRPKTGFELPYDRWLRSQLGRRIDDTLNDPALVRPAGLDPQTVARLWKAFKDGAPGLYWSRIWALYVLVHWCHRHRVYV
ncbi:asparagine synthase (glutamine-hydrolyzing) [Caldimonas caldifontis]|uniref:asparagine synthase (glutamine-hydrolyzing) n=1 Tax=Caldimonas caldifontis TaxID=1452508 RepID=A0A2S5SQD2_9BURK|nr:asparagine synthase (glutamine-hydrolyzing) [Caldimonas caldifontis]PPE64923.1 asparagine synthase (glutamine-hydrolyzing) [Caldimonas caldifontis]